MSSAGGWRRVAVFVAAIAAVLFGASVAAAHPTPGSTVFIDFTVDGARVEQDVPIEELERALHRQLAEPNETAEATVRRHRALLERYAAEHLTAQMPGGAPWNVQITDVRGHVSDDGPRALFLLALKPPRDPS